MVQLGPGSRLHIIWATKNGNAAMAMPHDACVMTHHLDCLCPAPATDLPALLPGQGCMAQGGGRLWQHAVKRVGEAPAATGRASHVMLCQAQEHVNQTTSAQQCSAAGPAWQANDGLAPCLAQPAARCPALT